MNICCCIHTVITADQKSFLTDNNDQCICVPEKQNKNLGKFFWPPPRRVTFIRHLSAWLLSYSRITSKVVDVFWCNFFGRMQYMTSKNWLDFGGDLDYITLWFGLGIQLPWHRFALWVLLFANKICILNLIID